MTEYLPDYIDPPIICVLGERGDGKTLVMTALGYLYLKVDNYVIWSNYHITGYPSRYFNFEELAEFPEDLRDAVVLLDEAHIGADAYEAIFGRVKSITNFITQLRKRNVTLLYSTQRFLTVAKRMRNMTNYTLEVEKTDIKGIIDCMVYDRQLPYGDDFIKYFRLDGRQFFNMYNTNEIIEL